MKKLKGIEFYYPPPKRGNVSWIYPWDGMFSDISTAFINIFSHPIFKKYLINKNKINKVISNFFPNKNTFFTNSGRSAILLTLMGIGIEPGDEVILCSFNCQAVIDPIINSGAKPVLVDSDKSGRIDVTQVNKYLSSRTKAIIMTNIYGILDNSIEIYKIAKKRNIQVISDLCQSLITPNIQPKFFKNESIFVYSFGPEKHLFALGGGAIFSNNKQFISKIQAIAGKDKVKNNELLSIVIQRIRYYFTFLVYSNLNFLAPTLSDLGLINKFNKEKRNTAKIENIVPRKMNLVQLNILSRKLLRLKKDIEMNNSNYFYLQNLIGEIAEIKFIPGIVINPLYATIIAKKDRYKLSQYLSENGVSSVWNYIPLHKFSIYSKYGRGEFSNVDNLWKKVLSIPFRYPLTSESIDRVARTIRDFYK